METLLRTRLRQGHSIEAIQQSFQDVLRNIQIERKGHISTLPFDMRLTIGNHLSKHDDFTLMSNLHIWCHALGKDVSMWLLESHGRNMKLWSYKIKKTCADLKLTLDWPMSFIILLQDNDNCLKCTNGTDDGHFIASIDGGFNVHGIQPLIKHSNNISVQVHEAILLKHSKVSPWINRDSISIQVLNCKRTIWWINAKPVKHVILQR